MENFLGYSDEGRGKKGKDERGIRKIIAKALEILVKNQPKWFVTYDEARLLRMGKLETCLKTEAKIL